MYLFDTPLFPVEAYETADAVLQKKHKVPE